jgi:acetolactate synthase regulatory subunit
MRGAGPWSLLSLVVVSFLFAIARGILVRGAEVDRIERRIERDTDRAIALYTDQIKILVDAASKKDATIASQHEQISKLLVQTEVSTQALEKIIREAERRGFFQP